MGETLELAGGFNGSVGNVGGACVEVVSWRGNEASIVGGAGDVMVHVNIFG